jgi:hypothetical protein
MAADLDRPTVMRAGPHLRHLRHLRIPSYLFSRFPTVAIFTAVGKRTKLGTTKSAL